MGYIYSIHVKLPGKLYKNKGDRYQLISSTNILENTTDDAQCWYDPTIQHFRLDDS